MKPKNLSNDTDKKTITPKDPVIEFLSQLKKQEGTNTIFKGTQEPDIIPNLDTVIVVIGISGSGKDTIAGNLHKNIQRVRTATTRKRRFKANENKFSSEENLNNFIKMLNSITDIDKYLQLLDLLHEQGFIEAEPADAYTWLHWLPVGSNAEDYIEQYTKKYELMECDSHSGALYGLPKANLDEVIKSGNVPVILTETNGYKTLKNIFNEQYNLLVLHILPDNMKIVEDSIRKRSKTTTKEEIATRMEEAIDLLSKVSEIAHFHILNSRIKGNIEKTKAEVVQLLQSLGVL